MSPPGFASRHHRSKAMKDEKNFTNFIVLWSTQTLSRLGSSLTPFALILWSYGETGSALSTALLTVSSYVPYILLSLPVGALTDRLDKKRLILAADTAAAMCTLAILLIWLSGSLRFWHLYLINALIGTAQTFQQPASEVAVTLVTPEDKYQKAGSLNALAYSIINMASPAIAAALYSAGGLPCVIAVDLLAFAISAVSLIFFVKIPKTVNAGYDGLPAGSGLKEAATFLSRNAGVLQVMLFLAAINFIASIYNAALPAMVLNFGNEAMLASIQSVSGIAMIVGSAIAAMLPVPKKQGKGDNAFSFHSNGHGELHACFFQATCNLVHRSISWLDLHTCHECQSRCIDAKQHSPGYSGQSVFCTQYAAVLYNTSGLSCRWHTGGFRIRAVYVGYAWYSAESALRDGERIRCRISLCCHRSVWRTCLSFLLASESNEKTGELSKSCHP